MIGEKMVIVHVQIQTQGVTFGHGARNRCWVLFQCATMAQLTPEITKIGLGLISLANVNFESQF